MYHTGSANCRNFLPVISWRIPLLRLHARSSLKMH
nr:MAG TPA: hypothetical protein [Caudoviricetes sp.]